MFFGFSGVHTPSDAEQVFHPLEGLLSIPEGVLHHKVVLNLWRLAIIELI